MDKFFISFLLLDEGSLMATALLLMVAGAILAARILKVNAVYRRVTYLWFIALLGLALTFSQFLWALTPAAADAGLLTALVLATMGVFPLFGAALYYGSAARSRDITGETNKAWLGFVPFANLWLILKGGEEPGPDAEARSRSAMSRLVLDPALVAGALFVLITTHGLDKALKDKPYYDATDSDTLAALVVEAQTLEESFATEAQLSKAQLPIRIDTVTVLSEIEARGRTLRITYDVEREIPGFRPGFHSTLAEMQCAPDMFAVDIARGGTVETIYRAPDGRVIETFEITQADCVS